MIEIFNADINDWVKAYKGKKFHAILCDPPYHLTSITKRFGKEDSAPAKFGTDGVFQRASEGFMGQTWDGGDIAFRPETWAALGELLYPGAFIMAYAGTRTYHRMAVAIEDAGFIIHPAIGYIFSSGFPKATNISKLIDRRLGLKGEPTGIVNTGIASGTHKHAGTEAAWGFDDEYETTIPSSPLAKTWAGHRYSLQSMKPSFEFICLAQKPYEDCALDDIVTNGAGALNIDAAKIGNVPIEANHSTEWGQGAGTTCYNKYGSNEKTNIGRWPANVVVQHLPECKKIGEEEVPYTINRFTDGAKPFGNGAGHEYESKQINSTREIWKCAFGCPVQILQGQMNENGTIGSAGEIFYAPQYVEEEIELSQKFMFASKVTPQERDAGMEKKNNHPTLKSIMLNRWLATLLLPPQEYAPRRILVPFAGVMSEAIGCELAGWEEIEAIEMTPEYVEIGKERVKYWTSIRSSGANARKIDKRQLSFDEI